MHTFPGICLSLLALLLALGVYAERHHVPNQP
jgi:hypothetical protein